MMLGMSVEILWVRKVGICRARVLDGGNRFRNLRSRESGRWCRLASPGGRGSGRAD